MPTRPLGEFPVRASNTGETTDGPRLLTGMGHWALGWTPHRPSFVGGFVELVLVGAFIQQYLNYLSGSLYERDSYRTKVILHTVIFLALVGHRPPLAWAELVRHR